MSKIAVRTMTLIPMSRMNVTDTMTTLAIIIRIIVLGNIPGIDRNVIKTQFPCVLPNFLSFL